MQNKYGLIIVVVIAIFLGVTLTVQQTNSPIMRRLVAQQEEILSLQKKLDRNRGEGTAGDADDLAAVNRKLDMVIAILKPLQQMQQRAQAPEAPSDEYTKVHTIPV